MRLPWPFQRRSQERPSDALPAEFPAPAGRGEWRGLPALDETIGPPPLIAPNSRFAGGLSTNPPPPTLAPLGHQRSLEAPHGMALGVAKPVSRLVDTEAGSRPVANRSLRQRLQRRTLSTATTPSGPEWPTEETGADVAAVSTTPASASSTPFAPSAPPFRRAPVVAPEAAIPPAPMTTAPAELVLASSPPMGGGGSPAPTAQRASAPPANQAAVQSARSIRSMLSTGAPQAEPEPAAAAAIQRAPNAQVIQRAPATSVMTAGSAAAPKLSLAQSRRAGLGAPLAAKPIAGVQRRADDAATLAASGPAATTALNAPLAGGLAPAIQMQRAPLTSTTSTAAAPASATAASAAAMSAPPASLPLAHPRPASSGAAGAPELIAASYRPSLQRAADVTARPIATAPPAAGSASASAPGTGHVSATSPDTVAPLIGAADHAPAATTERTTARPAVEPPLESARPGLRVQRRRLSDEPAHEPDEEPKAASSTGTQSAGASAPEAAGSNVQRATLNPEVAHEAGRETSSVQRETSSVQRAPSSIQRETSSIQRETSSVQRAPSSIQRAPSSIQREAGSSLAHPALGLAPSGRMSRARAGAGQARGESRPALEDGGLFGAQPLMRASSSLQRAPASPVRGQSAGPSSASAAPVRIVRDGPVAGVAAQLNAKAFTHAGDVYLPAHHGPLESGPARALLAHELTHVQQQRDMGSSLPAEHSPEGQRLERAAQSAEATGSLPLNLPLAMPQAARAARPAAVAQRSATGALSRATGDGDGEEPAAGDLGPTYVPGTTDISPGPTLGIQRALGPEAAPAAAEAHAAPGQVGHDPAQLDELATKLWERLRHRLRRELLHDRERSGMVADLS